MQKKKGISLIVLVITIIVMIILAAAVIITINNTNIIEKARQAVREANLKQVKDLATVAWSEAFVKPVDADVTKNDAYYQKEVIDYLKANGMTEEDLADYNIVATTEGVTVELNEDESEEDEPDTPELNEYGFYYDQMYVAQLPQGAPYLRAGYIAHEDGTAEAYYSEAAIGDILFCQGGG